MSSVLIIKSVTDKEWFPVNIHVIKDFFAKAGQLLGRYCKSNLELLPKSLLLIGAEILTQFGTRCFICEIG